MKLKDFIVADAIVADLAATDRDGALRELVTSLASADAVSSDAVDDIVAALIKREQNGSTGFGKGVAVPHVKRCQFDAHVFVGASQGCARCSLARCGFTRVHGGVVQRCTRATGTHAHHLYGEPRVYGGNPHGRHVP